MDRRTRPLAGEYIGGNFRAHPDGLAVVKVELGRTLVCTHGYMSASHTAKWVEIRVSKRWRVGCDDWFG